jgi:hypothetical protein
MDTLHSAIQKMGSNFIVASFVPAMAFVVFSLFTFLPIMPLPVLSYWNQIGDNFIETTVIILLFTILLGFTLFTLSTYIYKSFEGYTAIFSKSTPLGRAGLKRQKRRIKRFNLQKNKIDRSLEKIQKIIGPLNKVPDIQKNPVKFQRLSKYQNVLNNLIDRKYKLLAEYNANFPPQELILPTRFGNILRAAELYSYTRYGIDGVELWPRLSHLIPPEGMTLIDQANNECLFLLNSSLLAAISSVLCLLAAGSQFVFSLFAIANNTKPLYFLEVTRPPIEYQQIAIIYTLVCIFSMAVAWFFYEASLLNVGQFGAMIRSSYDLYRFRLLKALHLPLPRTLSQEFEEWDRISNFFATDHELDYNINFKYSHRQK